MNNFINSEGWRSREEDGAARDGRRRRDPWSLEPGAGRELGKPWRGFEGQRPDPILTFQGTLRAVREWTGGTGQSRENTVVVQPEVLRLGPRRWGRQRDCDGI